MGSAPLAAMGPTIIFSSSCVYPKVFWRRVMEERGWIMCSRSGRSVMSTMLLSAHSSHGAAEAIWALISASSTIRPCAVSTRNIVPGDTRPLRTILRSPTSTTPTSEAKTTRPSSVTQNRPGRSPLRSSRDPTCTPSVKATAAGPSHGSMKEAW